jgi:hypothetical protein
LAERPAVGGHRLKWSRPEEAWRQAPFQEQLKPERS